MKKEKIISEIKKRIKNFIRWFDFSGESFTFKYKDEDKLSTIFGGIIFISFYIFAIFYFIGILSPLHGMKVFELKYYDKNLNGTDGFDNDLKLFERTSAFAFGLTNNNHDYKHNSIYNIYDLFILETRHNSNGWNIPRYIRQCTKEDFIDFDYNQIIRDNINNLKCFDPTLLPYIHISKPDITYFTITVKSKYPGNETHDNLIAHYLTENDCRLQIYYTDISLDLENPKNPLSFNTSSMFLQLNPILIQKRDIYYMNYHLINDGEFYQMLFNFEEPRKETGLSRVVDYAVYKGLNRSVNNYKDNDIYERIYIKQDNRKILIKKEYKNLLVFYGEKSSLLLSLYWILCFFFSLYDKEKANHSISKKLFYFEGIENNRFKEFKKIKEIIYSNQVEERIIHTRINNISTYIRNITSNDVLTVNSIKANTNSNHNDNLEGNNKDKNKKEKLIDYSSFNLFEMFMNNKLCFCKTKKFESKVNLFKQAHKIIDDKLDIVLYIRNAILLEIINNIQLENKNIIDFLSRPIIYLNNEKERNKNSENEINDTASNASIEIDEEEIEQKKIDEKMNMPPIEVLKQFNSDNYKSAYHLNSDILSQKIEKLLKKEHKTRAEMKLLIYLKKQLKGVH